MTLMLFIVMALVTGGIGFLIGRSSGPRDRDSLLRPPSALGSPRTTRPPALTAEVLEEVHALIAANRKIDAIRLVRESSGLGLKEAKDFVETL